MHWGIAPGSLSGELRDAGQISARHANAASGRGVDRGSRSFRAEGVTHKVINPTCPDEVGVNAFTLVEGNPEPARSLNLGTRRGRKKKDEEPTL